LRAKGIDIKATDDRSWSLSSTDLVEKLDYKKAIEKYKPKLLLASWLPNTSPFGQYILNSEYVKHFIHIGEGPGERAWITNEYMQNPNWAVKQMENVEKYSICCLDSPQEIQGCEIYLFSRKSYS
jgi:hypothetical protein